MGDREREEKDAVMWELDKQQESPWGLCLPVPSMNTWYSDLCFQFFQLVRKDHC